MHYGKLNYILKTKPSKQSEDDDHYYYKNGKFELEEWEDVNYCEHSFNMDGNGLTDKEVVDLLHQLSEENKKLKQALREELQDNGNKYDIEIFDKLFNLNYDEWCSLENKDNWFPYDWEKEVEE